ncbi:MAG TPA: DUF6788 family protein [Dehalococcoidia bacterium]|nr:DUF6788 family protein [Dehalococcoidia bacterium]
MSVAKSGKPAPKMPLPGNLERRFVRCGKANCHCARGELHGPYYRRVFWSGGERRRRYVPLPAVEDCLARMSAWQIEREERREVRRGIRYVRRQLAGFRRTVSALSGRR